MFARRVFYNSFHNIFRIALFTMFLQMLCFPVLFFLQYAYRGEDGGSGLTFIYSLQFLYYSLSLSASNWDYLYYLLLRQGNSLILFWGREGDWGYLYC